MALEQQLELAVYLPLVRSRVAGDAQLLPLFPRYVFAHIDLRRLAPWHLQAHPGVIKVVGNGDEPIPVPATVIEALRQRVDQFNRQPLTRPVFQPGERVRLVAGPLAGLEAVFTEALQSGERSQVLLEFLGRQRRVTLATGALVATSDGRDERPRRGTRGKRRTIKSRA